MQIKPLAINQEGINTVASFAQDTSVLDTPLGSDYVGFGSDDQKYIPGISMPTFEKPFAVPLQGDGEAVSIEVRWPHEQGRPAKIIEFIGVLIAESVKLEVPSPEDERPFVEEDSEDYEADEAFDEYSGLHGFLRVIIEYRYETTNVNYGIGGEAGGTPIKGDLLEDDTEEILIQDKVTAELITIDTMDEFDEYAKLIDAGIAPCQLLAYLAVKHQIHKAGIPDLAILE